MNINNNSNNQNKKEHKMYVDYNIFQGKIRLILEGKSPIVIDRDDAIEMSRAENKNLVQIAYNKNDFPHAVCKILDYSKFKYDQKKKDKAAKKAARAAEADIKEIIFSIRIDNGDKNTKIDHIRKFLAEKNTKVKISIKLTRREMNLLGMAKDLMREILDNFTDIAELDSNPTFSSGIMSCMIRSKTK